MYKSIYGTNATDRSVLTEDELELLDGLCEEADNDRSAILERRSVALIARLARELGAARKAAAPVATGWRPIETAPKDGTDILAYLNVKTTEIVCWRSGHWMRWQNGHPVYHVPTHWQPLPPPPSEPTGDER